MKMRLEEEIVQRKFKNEHQKAVVNIFFTSNHFSGLYSKMLRPYELTMPQFNILRILRGQYPNPATIRLLTERMLDKMSNASRLVEKLRQKDLVDRDPCAEDRRQVNVKITEAGLDLLKRIDDEMSGIDNQFMGFISAEEAATLNAILDKMRG